MDFRFEVELGKGDGMAAKGIGFDDIRASLVVGTVNVADPIRTRVQQVLRAILEGGSTPVLDGRIALLEHGAHGPIEHKDTRGKRLFQSL